MSLLEQINSDMKAAMKAKAKDKLQAIRALKTAFTLEMTKTGASEIDDDSAIKLVQKLVKQRKDSADTYKTGGREDLAEKEFNIPIRKKCSPEQSIFIKKNTKKA